MWQLERQNGWRGPRGAKGRGFSGRRRGSFVHLRAPRSVQNFGRGIMELMIGCRAITPLTAQSDRINDRGTLPLPFAFVHPTA